MAILPLANVRSPGGELQTRATLGLMRRVVNDSVMRQAAIRERAAQIVAGVDGRDITAQVDAIRQYAARRLRFLPDPLIDGDVLHTPMMLLNAIDRQGFAPADCDDAAMFTAALLKEVGIFCRFVVFAFGDPNAPFSHVFTEALTPDGWRELDVTAPPPGRRLSPSRARVVEV